MTRVHSHKSHDPNLDVPDEFEPGAPPVQPDEGPVPAIVPEDPEHERIIAPGPNQARPAERPVARSRWTPRHVA